MKSAPSAKLMRTPIQSCMTKRCPLLKSHIKSEPCATCFAIVLYKSVLKYPAKSRRALNNETRAVRVTTMASSLDLPFCGATNSDQSSDLPFGEQSLYHPCWLLEAVLGTPCLLAVRAGGGMCHSLPAALAWSLSKLALICWPHSGKLQVFEATLEFHNT